MAWTSFLVLLSCFFTYVHAQSNLTVAFSNDRDTCEDATNPRFTLKSVPFTSFDCYNLDELFSGAGSGGNATNGTKPYNPYNLTLTNVEAYDPQTEYNQIWYHQMDSAGKKDEKTAARTLRLYPGRDCEQVKQNPDEAGGAYEPYVFWNYQSEEQGSCYSSSTAFESFMIVDARLFTMIDEKCLEHVALGNADGLSTTGKGVLAIIMGMAAVVASTI